MNNETKPATTYCPVAKPLSLLMFETFGYYQPGFVPIMPSSKEATAVLLYRIADKVADMGRFLPRYNQTTGQYETVDTEQN